QLDDWVDRPEVEAQQCVELTGTNRPRTWQLLFLARARCVVLEVPVAQGQLHSVSVAMAEGRHPVPSRTRKLSPLAPMVLPGRPGGRVGRRRDTLAKRRPYGRRFRMPARRTRYGRRGRPGARGLLSCV